MNIGIITLFPEIFNALNYGVIGRALERDLINVTCWNPRDFTHDKYRTVDDRPYGGGPGMLMKVQPLQDAIIKAKATLKQETKVIYVSPKGKRFNQAAAQKLSQRETLIFLAGRYEGVDARLLETQVDEQWSVGDYVLSGGEFAILTMIDALTRILPGVLGDNESHKQDSFVDGLLDYPHYTRPEIINGMKVPDVLISGDHKAIERWRMKQALGQTWLKRADLLEQKELSSLQQELLQEFIDEYRGKK
jgi:tRNA (guanine37-N1)-methyltransferase